MYGMNTEKESFGRLLIVTGEVYGKHVSPTLVNLYWRILQHYDWVDIRRAFRAYIENPDNGQYMPKPADLIRFIKGNSQSRSLQAWSKVEKAIGHVGPYRSVVFDDEIIHAVLHEMGGWIRLCGISEKELPFTAKEFQTRYTSLCNNPPNHFPKYFSGINEHLNGQKGFQNEPLVLLGDHLKAKALLEGTTESHSSSISAIVKNILTDARSEDIQSCIHEEGENL
jgi:hypothetical protein